MTTGLDDELRRIANRTYRPLPPQPKPEQKWVKPVSKFIGSVIGDFVGAAIIMGCLGFLHDTLHSVPALGYWFCFISLIALSTAFHCITYKAEKDES